MNIVVNLRLAFKSSGVAGLIYATFAKAGFLLKFILNGKSKGMKGLTKLVKREKVQSLSKEQKAEMKVMLLEQKPTTYGIDRQIWTGKSIIEVVNQRWDISR